MQRVLGRAREQGELKMVADQRLQPTFTADLAAALVEAVEAGAEGVLHLTAGGRVLLVRVHRGDRRAGRRSTVPIEAVETTVPEGGAARPLNGVLARPRADALGLTPLRDWREALADYMARAGLGGTEIE